MALVTGAAGVIGGAIARRLQAEGVRLALTDLQPEGLERIGAALGDADPLLRTGDLTRKESVDALFAAIQDRYGRVDIVVNAAGLLRIRPFEEIEKTEWDAVMDANVGSAFLVCQACCAPMRAQGWGRIINFSSIAGQVGGVLSGAHYAASKAAVISLTRSVAKHLAAHGVRCNAIAPSGVESEMLNQFTAEQKEKLRMEIPVQRFGTPEDVAELVTWLASPAADFVTGQTLGLNGGAHLG